MKIEVKDIENNVYYKDNKENFLALLKLVDDLPYLVEG